MMTTIEVLVFDGCPHEAAAVERAQDALERSPAPARLDVVRLRSQDEALRLRFLGSPTIRVDGVDVDASSYARQDFGMQCRVYDVDGKLEGVPPTAWIVAALLSRDQQGDRTPASQ